MRVVLALLLLAAPARAWEFSPVPICTLTHATEAAAVRVTYDPRIPQYAITLTLAEGAWPDGPIFAIRFDGAQGLTISTTRHVLSGGGAALTVTDRGFGNVLDGLQYNDTAIALLGERSLPIPLAGAAGPVADFRACTEGLAA